MSHFPLILKPSLNPKAIPQSGIIDNSNPPPKNPEEDYFYWYYLDKYFPNKFKRNCLIGAYTPDFLYTDENSGLSIDVECDEPYIYGTLTPTHYLESLTDKQRNNYISSQNIFIIRFAEEQIVKYPLHCCKLIATLIAEYTGNKVILTQFAPIADLPSVPQWNEATAKDLAKTNYRDSYLKQHLGQKQLPDRPQIIEGLKAFINVETDTQIEDTQKTWALPLSERVQLGRAIANLTITTINNNLIGLKCPENLSKFSPGDRLLLNQNNPFDKDNSYECVLQEEKDDFLTVRITRGSWLNFQIGTEWVLDEPVIDLRNLLLQPLNLLSNLPDTYDKILGILEGTIKANILPKKIPPHDFNKQGFLPKQKEAILRSLSTDNYYLIQGPPGTGKTWLLAHLAKLLAEQGTRVLITAFTHTAINNALRKIVQVTGYNRIFKIGEHDKTQGLKWEGGQVPNYENLDQTIYKNNIEGAIIGATCFTLGGNRLKDVRFDTIIFDEAGQITLPVAIRAMMYADKYIFIGDHQQMAPVIAGRHRQEWVKRSIFETLFQHTPGTMLDITHRMNQEINHFPSQYFYQGKLLSSPLAAEKKLIINNYRGVYHQVFDPESPSIFYQVSHQNRTTSSTEEADMIATMVEEAILYGIPLEEIAIVVPYRAQARLIRQQLQKLASKLDNSNLATLQVDTVESMQGQERDVMIFSLTTSCTLHAAQKAEFYFKLNRLNVAITRSRVKRIVVGCPSVFDAQPIEKEYQQAIDCFRAFYQSCEILPKLPTKKNDNMSQPNTPIEILFKQLSSLSDNATKTDLMRKIAPPLLMALGFSDQLVKYNHPTGNGQQTTDCVAYKRLPTYENKIAPFLVLQLQAREIKLEPSSTNYTKAVAELKNDLLAPKCRTLTWGIITNSRQIQVFRKHGKVVHPASKIYDIDITNIETLTNLITQLKTQIDNPPSALTVSIYNNKGGVGKTTTTINLAAILTLSGKRVLVIDFDANQQDLSDSLGIIHDQVDLLSILNSKAEEEKIRQAIVSYKHKFGKEQKIYSFDVIPSDRNLGEEFDAAIKQQMNFRKLEQLLRPLKYEYDYILIDTPPNWTFFSQSSLYAADAVLIPAHQLNLNSLKNAAVVIANYLPQLHEIHQYNKPIALPIFLNEASKASEAQVNLIQNTIDNILKTYLEEETNLISYFYPKYSKTNHNKEIFSMDHSVYISKADFVKKPAICCHISVYEQYQKLAKEYFLQ